MLSLVYGLYHRMAAELGFRFGGSRKVGMISWELGRRGYTCSRQPSGGPVIEAMTAPAIISPAVA